MSNHPEGPKLLPFPQEEWRDPLANFLVRLTQLVDKQFCQITESGAVEVQRYFETHISAPIHELGAVVTYFDEDFIGGRIARTFLITHFEEDKVVSIKKILKAQGITWPLTTYRLDDGSLAMNIVQCFVGEEPPKKKKEKEYVPLSTLAMPI